jgi:uncharacterized membrane protein
MRKAGVIWSPVLAVMYFISLLCMVLSVTLTLFYLDAYPAGDVAQFFVYFVGQGILYAIFPTISLAHANSFINPLVLRKAESYRHNNSFPPFHLP